jgi:hypothetical protein
VAAAQRARVFGSAVFFRHLSKAAIVWLAGNSSWELLALAGCEQGNLARRAASQEAGRGALLLEPQRACSVEFPGYLGESWSAGEENTRAPADTLASTLAAELLRSADAVAVLDPQVWDQPSACAEWTQAQVARHLVGSSFNALVARLNATLQGQPAPDPDREPVEVAGYREIQRLLTDGPAHDVPAAFRELAERARPVPVRVEARHGPLPAWHRRPCYVSTVRGLAARPV